MRIKLKAGAPPIADHHQSLEPFNELFEHRCQHGPVLMRGSRWKQLA